MRITMMWLRNMAGGDEGVAEFGCGVEGNVCKETGVCRIASYWPLNSQSSSTPVHFVVDYEGFNRNEYVFAV